MVGKQWQQADGDLSPSPIRRLVASFVSDAEEAGRSISEVVWWENHQKQLKTLNNYEKKNMISSTEAVDFMAK